MTKPLSPAGRGLGWGDPTFGIDFERGTPSPARLRRVASPRRGEEKGGGTCTEPMKPGMGIQSRMPHESRPRVWALLGPHRGDNNQVLALAEALGLPFEEKTLSYNQLRRVPPGDVPAAAYAAKRGIELRDTRLKTCQGVRQAHVTCIVQVETPADLWKAFLEPGN